MPTQNVEAELKRRDGGGALQNWTLATDAESSTGLADPVVEQGVRDRIDTLNSSVATQTTLAQVLTELQSVLTALQGTLTTSGSVTNFPAEYPLSAAQVSTLTPQTDGLTDTQLRATPVPIADGGGSLTVDGTVAVTGTQTDALTDTQLRAAPVPISDGGGSVTVDGTVAVTGTQSDALTDAELRASAVAVSGPLTDAQLRASSVPVDTGLTTQTNALTDAELRATAVPVSGPLTDTELRAAAVPVSDGGGSLTVDGTVAVSQPVAVEEDFSGGEVLADQSGSGVKTFTFAASVNLVVVHPTGNLTDCRADPFGGTPAASTGIPAPADQPTFIPVTTSSVKVYLPDVTSVCTVYGYSR